MLNNHLTPAEQTKQVIIPSNGLYNSFLGTMLDDEVETISDELTELQANKLNSFVWSLNLTDYNNKLVTDYSQFLIDTINDNIGCSIIIDSVSYNGLNGQNVGDNIQATIDVSTLPTLQAIADAQGIALDNLCNDLQLLANERFKSYSGFISFYETNISYLFNTDYVNWSCYAIDLLLDYMSSLLGCVYASSYSHISDIEQAYIEQLYTQGGAIELLHKVLLSADSDTLNKLAYPEGV